MADPRSLQRLLRAFNHGLWGPTPSRADGGSFMTVGVFVCMRSNFTQETEEHMETQKNIFDRDRTVT